MFVWWSEKMKENSFSSLLMSRIQMSTSKYWQELWTPTQHGVEMWSWHHHLFPSAFCHLLPFSFAWLITYFFITTLLLLTQSSAIYNKNNHIYEKTSLSVLRGPDLNRFKRVILKHEIFNNSSIPSARCNYAPFQFFYNYIIQPITCKDRIRKI